MEQLKKAIDGTKVQDSANPSKLTDTLKKLGYTISEESSFYILHNGEAYPTNAPMFAAVDNDEISAEELYHEVATLEAESVTYEKGDFLTCVTPAGLKLTFIYLKEFDGKTVVGHGQLKDGSIADMPHRYTKSYCRKANAAEISHFRKVCNESGWKIVATDGVASIKPCRIIGSVYYCIVPQFKNSSWQVIECIEEDTNADAWRYMTGNYFESKELAEAAANEFVKNVKSL